ncbi:MAG TPA: hypothetical protein PLT04_05010 [Candidatus Saccharibacteria bacterium]|nr:hypothetical protein [Candidatus Saccharibacteria bacterium]
MNPQLPQSDASQTLDSVAQPANSPATKQVVSDAAARIEAVTAATALKPRQRASEIYRIKAEYLKARYNVELKLSSE